jgi:hypothetical protein
MTLRAVDVVEEIHPDHDQRHRGGSSDEDQGEGRHAPLGRVADPSTVELRLLH